MNRYEAVQRELALALWDVGAVLTSDADHPLVRERSSPRVERGFMLERHRTNPDAPLSPFYFNLRMPLLTPDIIDLAARCMRSLQLEKKLRFDAVAGVPRAGNPFAGKLAELAGVCYLQLEKRDTGAMRLLGIPPARVKVALLVDDVVTRAGSKNGAILALSTRFIAVSDVMVLVDREEGGREEIERWGRSLHSVFTATELFDIYCESGRMSDQRREEVRAYLAASRR